MQITEREVTISILLACPIRKKKIKNEPVLHSWYLISYWNLMTAVTSWACFPPTRLTFVIPFVHLWSHLWHKIINYSLVSFSFPFFFNSVFSTRSFHCRWSLLRALTMFLLFIYLLRALSVFNESTMKAFVLDIHLTWQLIIGSYILF